MNVVLVGESAFVGRDVAEACARRGDVLVHAGQTSARLADVQGSFDLCVDLSSRSAAAVRTAMDALRGRCGHYVLVTGCEVYPATPRNRPWSVEEIDLGDESGVSGLDPAVAGMRAAERELRLFGKRAVPWTVLRPAHVEGIHDPSDRTWWFVQRILDGGPIVLPDSGLPTYRHVSSSDLASAILTVAGRSEAFGHALNVASQGILNYWGHGAMLMDGLHKRVHYTYVPARRWRAAGLRLPFGEGPSPSFIETSPLLRALGWEATDELTWVMQLAAQLAERPRAIDQHTRALERQLVHDTEGSGEFQLKPGWSPTGKAPQKQWLLLGFAGEPAALRLERSDHVPQLPPPILRTRRLAIGEATQKVLLGEWPVNLGRFAAGHNALLEVIEPGPTKLKAGGFYVPLSRIPCGVEGCRFCSESGRYLLGIDCDGYGAAFVTTPPEHLVEVPHDLTSVALLADPLAVLVETLGPRLREGTGPVWIAGRTADAYLAGLLAQDAGRPVIHVDRVPHGMPHTRDVTLRSHEELLAQLARGEEKAPAIVVDFSGSAELARTLGHHLAPGGVLLSRQRTPLVAELPYHVPLAPVAHSRKAIEDALQLLRRWMLYRDLPAHVGPAVPTESFWDVLLPAPFSLPYIDATLDAAEERA